MPALRGMLRTGKYGPAANHNGHGNGNGNSAAAQHSNGNGAATGEGVADTPACPKCGGAMWDNRAVEEQPARAGFQVQEGRLRWGDPPAE